MAKAHLIEFQTSRLQLRQWNKADRQPFAALNADPRVMQFFPASLSREQSDAMASRCEALIDEHELHIDQQQIRVPGFAQPIQYAANPGYADLSEG